MKTFIAWLVISIGLILCSLFFKATSPTVVTGGLIVAALALITAICRKGA